MEIGCCRLADVASLRFAAGLLLADLSWNNIEQIPGQLLLTLLSLKLSRNRLCDLTSTLAELAKLPKLRSLHLLPALHACRSVLNKFQLSAPSTTVFQLPANSMQFHLKGRTRHSIYQISC